jgi:hypothetical protein
MSAPDVETTKQRRTEPKPPQFALVDILFVTCAVAVLVGWWSFLRREGSIPEFRTAEESYSWIRAEYMREHVNRGLLVAFLLATYFFGCYRWPRMTAGLLFAVLALPLFAIVLLALFSMN